jgi:hypothetical protein
MHTFLLFFAWPNGGAWSNVAAMPLCGIAAGIAAFIFRDHIGRALSGFWRRHFGHHAELDKIKATLGEHADALDLSTPGGLAAVMAEIKETRMAAESALAAVQALGVIAGSAKTPRRGKTEMRPTAGGDKS